MDHYQYGGEHEAPSLRTKPVNGLIAYTPLDADWDEPYPEQGYSPKSARPILQTEFLLESQGKDLCNASLYADSIGCMLGCHVTIHWEMSFLFPHDDPRRQMAFQGDIFDKTTKMLKREGLDQIAFVWVIENTSQKHRHTHWQINVPHRLRSRLKDFLLDTGHFSRARLNQDGEAIRVKVQSEKKANDGTRVGTLIYALKGMRPTEWLPGTNGVGIFNPLGIRTERSLPILGKRCGTSQNIGEAAHRCAGWTEKTDWAEIDSAILGSRIGKCW